TSLLTFKSFPQYFRRMLGFSPRGMVDLLTAGDAGSDDLDVRISGADSRGETALGDGERDVVVLLLEAEGARHAAAARIDFRHLVARPLEHFDRRRGADERFLMTMAVEQGFFAVAGEM